MRKQVIDIFSQWIEVYLTHQTEIGSQYTAFQIWWETNHKAVSDDIRKAVIACFERKPSAICSWFVEENGTINVVIRQPNINNKQTSKKQ